MVLAEPAQLEPWARCPWDATQINGERESRELRRRGKVKGGRCWGMDEAQGGSLQGKR